MHARDLGVHVASVALHELGTLVATGSGDAARDALLIQHYVFCAVLGFDTEDDRVLVATGLIGIDGPAWRLTRHLDRRIGAEECAGILRNGPLGARAPTEADGFGTVR